MFLLQGLGQEVTFRNEYFDSGWMCKPVDECLLGLLCGRACRIGMNHSKVVILLNLWEIWGYGVQPFNYLLKALAAMPHQQTLLCCQPLTFSLTWVVCNNNWLKPWSHYTSIFKQSTVGKLEVNAIFAFCCVQHESLVNSCTFVRWVYVWWIGDLSITNWPLGSTQSCRSILNLILFVIYELFNY